MTCTSKCGPTCVLGSGGASGALRCATWRATGACDRRFGHLLETEMRGREFQLLGRLVASAPVLRLHPHRDGQLAVYVKWLSVTCISGRIRRARQFLALHS